MFVFCEIKTYFNKILLDTSIRILLQQNKNRVLRTSLGIQTIVTLFCTSTTIKIISNAHILNVIIWTIIFELSNMTFKMLSFIRALRVICKFAFNRWNLPFIEFYIKSEGSTWIEKGQIFVESRLLVGFKKKYFKSNVSHAIASKWVNR